MRKLLIILSILLFAGTINAQQLQIALLKYNGGGDWYANPTSLPNLVKFCNKNLNTNISQEIATVDIGNEEIFNFPFTHITGHGNIILSPDEANNLRNYLLAGGFLHISDNYGLNEFVRREMKKVFPELEFIELPFDHPIYHQKYQFADGLPKIHEHDDLYPQGFGLIWEGRLICFYDFECDLGDGWEDIEVHNDTEINRLNALQMGANIIEFAFTQ